MEHTLATEQGKKRNRDKFEGSEHDVEYDQVLVERYEEKNEHDAEDHEVHYEELFWHFDMLCDQDRNIKYDR